MIDAAQTTPLLEIALDVDAHNRLYDDLLAAFSRDRTGTETIELFERWEFLRREFYGWTNAIEIRFRQNTVDERAIADSKLAASWAPIMEQGDAEIKAHLLRYPRRRSIEPVVGASVLDRWRRDIGSVNEAVRHDLETELRLGNDYVTVLANVSCTFQGQKRALSEMSRFNESTDRQERRHALNATWSAVDANSADLDGIFDELVDCRVRIATKLGYSNFMDLAYDRLGRVDYGPSDVATFRKEILDSIVPACRALAESQAKGIGVEALMPWDEILYDDGPTINGPSNGLDALRAIRPIFTKMHPELGRFTDEMIQRGLFDLDGRPAKASGAFCSFLPQVGMPFVFGSFGGTSRDLTSVVHEMGHAFQNFQSRRFPVLEHVVPTNEIGEIHSLALEFLIWPHCREFFGNDSERYKARHLRSLIGMLPYIAAVDHFQEAIYQQPHLRADERHAVWLEMEALYMPWRSHGDIPGLARGARWQLQRHIYRFPFYYIDYGLALCCALQLWNMSLANYGEAVRKYASLCVLGGSLPFRALVDASGLRSPFDSGTLADVADQALRLLPNRD